MVARHSNGNWVGGAWQVYELKALFGCCLGEHHPLDVDSGRRVVGGFEEGAGTAMSMPEPQFDGRMSATRSRKSQQKVPDTSTPVTA